MERFKLDALNAATSVEFVTALANIFEYSPWIADAAAAGRPYATLAELRDAMMAVIEKASSEDRMKLIRSHPDLANKTQRAAGLTADSTSEQDGAGLDRLSSNEFILFEQSNNAYKAKFGFPFILCVKRHTKDSILDAFRRRLKNSAAEEEQAAVAEIGRIATLRLAQQVVSRDELPVFGHLSTHVLDSHAGKPAAGVEVQLVELSRHGESRTIVKTVTDQDGRTGRSLVHGRPVPMGTYELRFKTAAYYTKLGVALSDPPFLDTIPIQFSIAEPEARYHVPLLMTPWSYSTYRGS
jgi:2-oxo-4-hydroxy-4-carboxy-5-ureidoimidazoline decarboxylase